MAVHSIIYVLQNYTYCYFSLDFNITIDCGISALGHDIEVIEGLIATDKRLVFQLMVTVKLHLIQSFSTQIVMHTSTYTDDVILVQEFQKRLSNTLCKHCIVDYGGKSNLKKWTNK